MITAIRDVRRAKGLTLDEVARRCVPPTTPQTVGRLEMGTRTVSVGWLNRIAAALGVSAAELVRMPDRPTVPVAATLDGEGAHPLAQEATAVPPAPPAGGMAVRVAAGVGDYRAGDEIWCEPVEPDRFTQALNRDVLAPRPGGRFAFGRLIALEGRGRVLLLPPGPGARQQAVARPAWLAQAVRLVRTL